jgi:hypothetical protein
MAVIVRTDNPAELLRAILEGIDKGSIRTWSLNDSRRYLTHSVTQWRALAWMKFTVGTDNLTFNIVRPKDRKVTVELYAVYHGRLIEMLLAHFDQRFLSAQATALPTEADLV